MVRHVLTFNFSYSSGLLDVVCDVDDGIDEVNEYQIECSDRTSVVYGQLEHEMADL